MNKSVISRATLLAPESARGVIFSFPMKVSLGLLLVLVLGAAPWACGAVVVTEIYFNGPAVGEDRDEFLEIHNSGATPVDLSGSSFEEGFPFSFPDGTILAPRESIVITVDFGGFAASFPGFSGRLFEWEDSNLSDLGEDIVLSNPSGYLFDVIYGSSSEWPASANGLGDSLQVNNLEGARHDPTAWRGAAPSPGVVLLPEPGVLSMVVIAVIGAAQRRVRGAALADPD